MARYTNNRLYESKADHVAVEIGLAEKEPINKSLQSS